MHKLTSSSRNISDRYQILAEPFRKALRLFIGSMILGLIITFPSGAQAAELDQFGPPPQGGPSAFTDPVIGEDAARALEALPPANEGAFEGGPTGTHEDPGLNNFRPKDRLTSVNIPTNGRPSPLFRARSFRQQMLRFEEFGTEPLDPNAPPPARSFPIPKTGRGPERDPISVAASAPAGTALEAFLAQKGISPFPTRLSNTTDMNPWKTYIETFLGRPLDSPPAEGRPPGEGWSHQRWNEFKPEIFFKTAQAGARVNGGFRDSGQMHRYSVGEFGPGGLYNRVYRAAGIPETRGTTKGLGIRFHPNMPIQNHKSLWTFDGTLPPKLLMARHGQAVLMRHYNALPIDPSANRGFGLHTITTHLHNGHSPAESDGYTNAYFFPGQFYDYRWARQLAGYDTINTDATDPRAGFPCAPGEKLFVNDLNPGYKTCPENGRINIRGDWRETMSTNWFHDHMLDFTAQNVYKGNAVMVNNYSVVDRGNESINDGINLRFPSGTVLPWGNRDYDVNLVIADKAWDQRGQLWFNIFNFDGFLGDQVLTNWLYDPYFDVRARRYRFRILNGSVSRYFSLALVHQVKGNGGEFPGPTGSGISYNRVPFHMIGNDGNIMEHTVPFDGKMDLDRDGDLLEHKGHLPTLAIAERYDIVVDFSKHGIKPGDLLYFVNVLEHKNGRRPNRKIPLKDVLFGQYRPRVGKAANGRLLRWEGGDPAVKRFLELRVRSYPGRDLSMEPTEFEPGKKKMIPLPIDRDSPADRLKLASARHRSFDFVRSAGTDEAPWTIKTDGGQGFTMDPRRISAAPQLSNGPTAAGSSGDGTLEIWSFSTGGGWSHPVHVHFEEGVILTRDGKAPPEWEKWARKDVYRIGPEEDGSRDLVMAIRFREFAGTYMEHCHNTQHEDHSMLLRWDLEHPGQVQTMPAPIPSWDGVEFVDSTALPTFRSGDGFGPNP